MLKYYSILSLLIFLFVSCEKDSSLVDIDNKQTVSMRLNLQKSFNLKIVDDDNLENEQKINNISVFFTEPSSVEIIRKYVYTGFSVSGDYQLITLPLTADSLLSKDIYVIANYDNETALNSISSVDRLNELLTPQVDKTNILNPSNGLCMSGVLRNFDFTDTSVDYATVPLVRTCAKFRVTLTFPDNYTLSTNNSFLIQNAAKYTFVYSNSITALPQTDYFNYAAPMVLPFNGNDSYINTTYVYEAVAAPLITVYTHINNSVEQQEYTATLPIPVRNYLYDLSIEVYEDTESNTRIYPIPEKKIPFFHKTRLTIYDDNDIKTEEILLD